MFSLAQQVNGVDLDKITFIRLPVYDLDGEYAGRVAPIPDRSAELFALLASDSPLVLAEANPGTGAVVAEDSAVTTETPVATDTESTDPESTDPEATDPAATETEAPVLPEWVQGTNAATKSCSN
jgi:hypothetical protein